MELLGMSLSDFSSKLGASTFRVNGMLFRLNGVSGEDEDNWEGSAEEDVYLYGETIVDRSMWEDTRIYPFVEDTQIDISFPQAGYVNYRSGAVYATRNVERQYKYGYNSRVVEVTDRFSEERQDLNLMYAGGLVNNPRFIARLFDRFFFTYHHAIALVRSGQRLGAAIHPYVYIGRSGEFNKPIICYKDKVVGYVDGSTNYLFPEADYVGRLLPNVTIKEDVRDVIIGLDGH